MANWGDTGNAASSVAAPLPSLSKKALVSYGDASEMAASLDYVHRGRE